MTTYRKIAIVVLGALTLGACAGSAAKRVDKYGKLLDIACRAATFDSVVVAVQKRPELAVALPILCPETIGVFMAIANQPRPGTLNIQLMPAAEPATEEEADDGGTD